MTFVVDRLEGEFVVCENIDTLEMFEHPKSQMPEGVKEGDVVVWTGEGSWIDRSQTECRREKAMEMLKKIMK